MATDGANGGFGTVLLLHEQGSRAFTPTHRRKASDCIDNAPDYNFGCSSHHCETGPLTTVVNEATGVGTSGSVAPSWRDKLGGRESHPASSIFDAMPRCQRRSAAQKKDKEGQSADMRLHRRVPVDCGAIRGHAAPACSQPLRRGQRTGLPWTMDGVVPRKSPDSGGH